MTSDKRLLTIESQLKQISLESGAGTSSYLTANGIDGKAAWWEMLIVCREAIQDRVTFINSCSTMSDINHLYATKVNAIWDLLQKLMGWGIESILSMDLSQEFDAIHSMPEAFTNKRALDEFFPSFGKDMKYYKTPEYQKFLNYLKDYNHDTLRNHTRSL